LNKQNLDKKDAFYEKRTAEQISCMTKIVEETYQKHQGSIPASSDTVESEGREMKQCWIKSLKNPLLKRSNILSLLV